MSPTSDTCGFFKDEQHGVISALGTSAHSYSRFSVLSIPHLYGKCCVPLFCGGLLSLCLKKTSNRVRGAHDGLNMIKMAIFYSLTSLSLAIVVTRLFSVDGKVNRKTQKSWHRCHHVLTDADKCFTSLLVNSSDV